MDHTNNSNTIPILHKIDRLGQFTTFTSSSTTFPNLFHQCTLTMLLPIAIYTIQRQQPIHINGPTTI